MQRLVKIGMKIEQQIEAALIGKLDVTQNLAGIRERLLGRGVELDALESVGDAPAERRLGQTHRQPGEEFDHPRLLDRLDQDDRRVGT